MNLDKYYKESKDEINSSIMEIASSLAISQLINKYQKPFEEFLQPEDPNYPDNDCTRYKEEYQDVFNQFYDKEYERLTKLMKFDYNAENGQIQEAIVSNATEVTTTYANVRYDIENITGAEVTNDDINDVLDQIWTDTKVIGDYIVSIEICGRNDESSF